MVDPIDEYALQSYPSHAGHRFVSITREGVELPKAEGSGDDATMSADDKEGLDALCSTMKQLLGQRVTRVAISERLSSAPCALVTAEYGWSANMERIMRAQVGIAHF